MALKPNIKRNPSYVESIDDEYLTTSSSSSSPPQPSASSSTTTKAMASNDNSKLPSYKPGPVIFHRKMFSADGFGNSASAATTPTRFVFLILFFCQSKFLKTRVDF